MTAARPASFLAVAGAVAVSLAKHVVGRAILWGFIGFVVGCLAVGASFVLGLLVLERGALLLGYLLAIPAVIPVAGAALFAVHGTHRGAARAALELERKFGLVRHVVDKVFDLVQARLGGPLASLPLAKFEEVLKGAVTTYLGSDDMREGSGVTGWLLRRAKRAIVGRIETYTLAAYRAEEGPSGSGGVSVPKVAERVSGELSDKLAGIVMSPLNKQLAVFMLLYVGVGVGWWGIPFGVMSLLIRRR